jgi:hypothetical protein
MLLIRARCEEVLLYNANNEPAAYSTALGQQIVQSGLVQLLSQLLTKAAAVLHSLELAEPVASVTGLNKFNL